jgi:hypothetical protein
MCCVYDGLEPHNHYEPLQDTNNPISIARFIGNTKFSVLRRNDVTFFAVSLAETLIDRRVTKEYKLVLLEMIDLDLTSVPTVPLVSS